jgi:hypothetical protein
MEEAAQFIKWNDAALGAVLLIVLAMVTKIQTSIRRSRADEMYPMIQDLHAWHAKEDEDGSKVWYVKKSLETAIVKLADAMSSQAAIMERLLDRIESIDDDLKEIKHGSE